MSGSRRSSSTTSGSSPPSLRARPRPCRSRRRESRRRPSSFAITCRNASSSSTMANGGVRSWRLEAAWAAGAPGNDDVERGPGAGRALHLDVAAPVADEIERQEQAESRAALPHAEERLEDALARCSGAMPQPSSATRIDDGGAGCALDARRGRPAARLHGVEQQVHERVLELGFVRADRACAPAHEVDLDARRGRAPSARPAGRRRRPRPPSLTSDPATPARATCEGSAA